MPYLKINQHSGQEYSLNSNVVIRKLSLKIVGKDRCCSLKQQYNAITTHQTTSVAEYRQLEVLAKTEIRHNTVQLRTNPTWDNRRWSNLAPEKRQKPSCTKRPSNKQSASLDKDYKVQFLQRKTGVDNQRPFKESYAEVGTFKNIHRITLFTKEQYKFVLSFGLTASGMCHISCIFDTRAGVSLLQEDLLKPCSQLSMSLCKSSRLKRASTLEFNVVEILALHARISGSYIRLVSGLLRNVTLSVFLGTLFID